MESFAKEYLIQALFLLMEKEEYKKISVTDICDKAGVSRLSFYRIFQTKENIIKGFFKQKEEQFVIQNIGMRTNNIQNTITACFTGLYDERKRFDLIIKNHLEQIYLDYLNDSFSKSFKEMKYEVSTLTPYIYAGMLYNATLAWAKEGYRDSPEVMSNTIYRVIFNNGNNQ